MKLCQCFHAIDVVEQQIGRRVNNMNDYVAKPTPPSPRTDRGDISMESYQDIEFRPPAITLTHTLTPPSTGSFRRKRTTPPKRSPLGDSDHSSVVPFVGDVDEPTTPTTSNSWIFPTEAMSRSTIVPVMEEEDISFVPPTLDDDIENSDDEGPAVVAVPIDGSFLGDPELFRKTILKSPEGEISFVPPQIMRELSPVVPIPLDGSFRGDRKLGKSFSDDKLQDEDISFVPPPAELGGSEPVVSVPLDGSFRRDRKLNPSLSNDSRDIDFSPAGSAMETAPPPLRGSYIEGRQPNPIGGQEINVTPDTAGKDMPTSPPPKQGGFIRQHEGNALFMSTTTALDREINFSPGGSEMQTAAPPVTGSYIEGRRKGDNSLRDINVMPEMTGKSMPTSSPPLQGSFIGHHGEIGEPSAKDSWIFPQMEDREINFSPGASDMETASPPIRGSFLGGPRHISPFRGSTTHQEINVMPDTVGKNMPTSSPPNRGSFMGQLDHKDKVKAVKSSLDGERPSPMHEISDTQPHNDSQSKETHVPEVDTFLLRTNSDEEVEGYDSDPMEDDQDIWRAKKLWDSATLKKKNAQHSLGQEIISGSDSDLLTDSIHKLGALIGSVHQDGSIPAMDSKDEQEDLSESIQKLGALLGSTHAVESARQGGDVIATDDDVDERSEPLDNLLEDDDINDDDETPSSDSIVELGSLPEPIVRSAGNDDDVTVHINNTSKHCEETRKHKNEIDEDESVLDDDMAKLEALLDKALDAPLEEVAEHEPEALDVPLEEFMGDRARELGEDEAYVPNDSISKLEAFLDEALDSAVEELVAGKSAEAEANGDDDEYVPDDSIARLEAFLDEALDAPLEEQDSQERRRVLPEQSGIPEDSTSGLEEFLDRALDDGIEIMFEPTEEESRKPGMEETTKPTPTPKAKATGSQNRWLKTSQPATARSKKSPASSEPMTMPSLTRKKTIIPGLRGTNRVFGEKKQRSELSSKKPLVPQLQSTKSDGRSGTSRSFITAARTNSNSASATDRNNGTPKSAVARTKKIMSKLTSWTTRTNEKPTDASKDESNVPMYTLAESRNKGRTAPVRLFGGKSTTKKQPSDKTIARLAEPKSPVVKRPDADLTGVPSIPSHPDFYTLSPLAQSVASLSSQCSVDSFQSPRREGVRGCQKRFNPYLHNYPGPCELCVFFLSAEDKAKLDATGRHYRVMFTTGGCCSSCEVFPRSKDSGPVRLCRMCYGNSHRRMPERPTLVRRLL